MKEIIIVGAGGFGRELLQWIKDINKAEKKWNIRGFIDDDPDVLDGFPCDYKVVGTIRDWEPEADQVFACGIAKPDTKEAVTTLLKAKGAKFTPVIHPTAMISDFAHIGEGLVMYPNSGININTRIGNFVTLLSSGVGHDVHIGDYVTISSCCDITGGVRIEEKAFLGSHVTVVPKKIIGRGAFVGAGSVVMTNIRSGYKVMGNPAKKVDL